MRPPEMQGRCEGGAGPAGALGAGHEAGAGVRGLPPLPDTGARRSRPAGKRFRATLTKEQAALIYTLRPPDKDDPNPNKIAGNSQLLSKRFGVSPKAVRDVWNRRTWAHATKDTPRSSAADLDLLERCIESENAANACPEQHELGACSRVDMVQRSPGRPIGSKDSKPRRRRTSTKGLMGACGLDEGYMPSQLRPPSSSRAGQLSHVDYGWATQSNSPQNGEGFECGDAMEYLYPSTGAGLGSAASDSSETTREADIGTLEDPSDDRSFPFFLSASILGQGGGAEFTMPQRTNFPSQGTGPMGFPMVGGARQWQQPSTARYDPSRHSMYLPYTHVGSADMHGLQAGMMRAGRHVWGRVGDALDGGRGGSPQMTGMKGDAGTDPSLVAFRVCPQGVGGPQVVGGLQAPQ